MRDACKVFFIGLFWLQACTMIPKNVELETPIPKRLPTTKNGETAQTAAVTATSADNLMHRLRWQDFYRSEDLKRLIRQGLAYNRNYRAAELDVKALEAQYDIQKNLLPTVSAGASLQREKIPANAPTGGTAGGYIQNRYRLEVGITSYELDLFGRLRSLKEAALQEYLASRAAKDSVKILLIAQVAAAYLQYLADKELLRLAEKTVRLQEEVIGIIRRRRASGIASELELQQARTLLETVRTDAVAQSRQVMLDRNALRELTGASLEKETFESFNAVLTTTRQVPVSLDSRVLLRRPDIQQAERTLLAANARIGAARAAFFPTISLTTSVGKMSAELANLFAGDSSTWMFFPRISLPIFTGGRNSARLRLAEVRKEQSVANYEATIQSAFHEVSDALISNEKLAELLRSQERAVEAAQKTYSLSRERYESGVDSYLTNLDAQRSLYQAQRALLGQQLAYLANYSFLYKALGGGI